MAYKRFVLTAAGVACGLALSTASLAHDGWSMGSSSYMGASSYIEPAAIEEGSVAAMDRGSDATALSLDNLVGAPVRDFSGERVGTVRDALFDEDTGKIGHLIVASDIYGTSMESAVPFDSVLFSDNAVILNDEREALLSGPMGDEFFGVSPSDEGASMDSSHDGASLQNRTGQPPDRWDFGSSPEGRNY